VLALDHDGPAIYNIADVDPAPVREWLPALGAKPPRHVPVWLARLFAGGAAVVLATESRGASNAKAKRELGWTPRYPSWREGFAAVYASRNGGIIASSHSARSSSPDPGGTKWEVPGSTAS
jgi:nucleoside-diphosphate-sugar epimerase